MTEYSKRLGYVAAAHWAVALLAALVVSQLPKGPVFVLGCIFVCGVGFIASVASYCFAAEWTEEVNPNKKERDRHHGHY